MDLSVVLLTWNSQDDVAPCLDSILEATRDFKTEILVVDNGSVDHTLSILSSYGQKVSLITLCTNVGVARARNIALARAKGKRILILDIDTISNASAINAMMAFMDSNPDCGICGCRLESLSGDIQSSCRRMPRVGYKVLNVLTSKLDGKGFLNRIHSTLSKMASNQFYGDKINGTQPFDVEYVIGACQMFHRSLIASIGMLDEAIFYGPEDADFCLRASKIGLRVCYIPSVSIIHHYNRITSKKVISSMGWLHMKGLIHFYWKHRIF